MRARHGSDVAWSLLSVWWTSSTKFADQYFDNDRESIMSANTKRTHNYFNLTQLTYGQRLTLLRRATLGLSLISALSFSGCGEMAMEGDNSYSESYHSGREQGAPNYTDDFYGEAAGESVAEEYNQAEAIIDGVDLTYNQEEDASRDNQLTFAVDVDTASYTIARSYLSRGQLPPKETVRVEEFVNFFDYEDEGPETLKDSPFSVHLDAAKAPFAENRTLLRIGLKGYEVADAERPPTNLVFLIDTSGSMSSSIELVRNSLGLLLDSLNADDTIAMVTYAGNSSVDLSPTPVSNRDEIITAMDRLQAGGSTNGAGGITTAYDLAEDAFKVDGLNRVVLCTDGDFNVGVTGDELYELIEEKRESGITLSVLGFGHRYNDTQMEQLADRGNGNYSFIDSLREAQRALVDRLTATLMVIAKDVKVQLEVNPTLVKTYRLLGYENRAIADNDFRNDQVDAGEIGAGHTVTALVELELYPDSERPTLEDLGINSNADTPSENGVDEPSEPSTEEPIVEPTEESTEEATRTIDPIFERDDAPLALLRLRNKTPDASAEDPAIEQVHELSLEEIRADAKTASPQLRFAAAVAEFAEILRDSPFVDEVNFEKIIELADESKIEGDEWMAEFIELVRTAQSISERSR